MPGCRGLSHRAGAVPVATSVPLQELAFVLDTVKPSRDGTTLGAQV